MTIKVQDKTRVVARKDARLRPSPTLVLSATNSAGEEIASTEIDVRGAVEASPDDPYGYLSDDLMEFDEQLNLQATGVITITARDGNGEEVYSTEVDSSEEGALSETVELSEAIRDHVEQSRDDARSGDGEWDESKHPRDENGKFA